MSWQRTVLVLAGIYNIIWGAWVVFFPKLSFSIFEIQPPRYIEIWQCVGMIVGVYGIGYLIASRAPQRHWPIVFVGLLGKIFGPIGFLLALYNDVFPLLFGFNIIFNDLIWWIPFSLILFETFKSSKPSGEVRIEKSQFSSYPKRKKAQFINSLSGFKSINLIGTKNERNETNLSIISSAFHLGSDPALIGFIIRPDVSPRHTLDNLRTSRFCTLNHVNEDIYKQSHQTSARYNRDQSEFKYCGLIEKYKDDFPAPFVNESYVSMSLEIEREVFIQENATHFIIAKIKDVYVPKNCLENDGSVNLEKAKTLCLSGLDNYHQTQLLDKLSYAKPFTPVRSL
jgi:flavin reductase (DIM6/NTAB) family NADH-FMN oxidoreductase RutF